jgi:hypothetical protein
MKAPIGISSSCGDWTTLELVEICKLHGLGCVDLRAGRGQRWELEGAGEFLSHGNGVTFFGSDIVIGDPNFSISGRALDLAVLHNVAIRVFLAHNADVGLLDNHIEVLAEALGRKEMIWFETHRGYAGAEALAQVCSRSSCGVILDNFGLFQISEDPEQDADLLGRYVRAMQVKGFSDIFKGVQKHVTLSNLSNIQMRIIAKSLDKGPVILESKAGSLDEDFEFIRDMSL